MDFWLLLIAYVFALIANAAASIFWGLHYKRATNRLLEAKDAQMAILRELSSTKVFEHFQSTKALLEDSIRDKEEQIRALLEDRQLSRDELHNQLLEMKDNLLMELQLSKEAFERDMRLLATPRRIDALEFPLDLREVEAILLDAGLSATDVKDLISKVVTLPRDWSIGRVRNFLRESLLEAKSK